MLGLTKNGQSWRNTIRRRVWGRWSKLGNLVRAVCSRFSVSFWGRDNESPLLCIDRGHRSHEGLMISFRREGQSDRAAFLLGLLTLSSAPKAGGLGLIPSQETRPFKLQLTVHRPQLKVPHAAAKTWHSQNK